MAKSNNQLLGEIARLYYENNLTQSEIANKLNISRPLVSNKLAEAKEKGIVKIFINTNDDINAKYERKIFSSFDLRGLKIIDVPNKDASLVVQMVAQGAADYFSRFITKKDIIGVSLGWTTSLTAESFPKLDDCETDTVVQCLGGVSDVRSKTSIDGVISNFSNKVNSREAYTLACPPIVETKEIANAFKSSRMIKNVLEKINSCNKLLVNITTPDKDNCFYRGSYYDDNDVDNLQKTKAVGGICGRFYNEKGEICNPDLDARTIGVTLDKIMNTSCVMAAVSGKRKANALYYALKNKMIDVLAIDSILALELIRIIDESED